MLFAYASRLFAAVDAVAVGTAVRMPGPGMPAEPRSEPAPPLAAARSIFYPNFNVTSFSAYAQAAPSNSKQNDSATYSFTVQWSTTAPVSNCNTTVPSPNHTLADVATTSCTGPEYYEPAFRWTNQDDGSAMLAFEVLYQDSINGAAATWTIAAEDIVWVAARAGSGAASSSSEDAVQVQKYVGPEAFEMAPIPV